jgi:hypothetical protein
MNNETERSSFITIQQAVEITGTPKNTFRSLIRKNVVLSKRDNKPGTKQKIVLIDRESIPQKYYKHISDNINNNTNYEDKNKATPSDADRSTDIQKDFIDTLKYQLKEKDETIKSLTEANNNQIKINANLNQQISQFLQLTSGNGDDSKKKNGGLFYRLSKAVFGKK